MKQIEGVVTTPEQRREDIIDGINNSFHVALVHLTGEKAFKRPNWLGATKENPYNALQLKDQILAEFDKHPNEYGYGVILGKQNIHPKTQKPFYFICIDFDLDGDCLNQAYNDFCDAMAKNNIGFASEQTRSGRYHIYVALDKLTETLKNTNKLVYKKCKLMKIKDGKEVDGAIELLGTGGRKLVAVYNGVITNQPPVFKIPAEVFDAEAFERALSDYIEFKPQTKNTQAITPTLTAEYVLPTDEDEDENEYIDMGGDIDPEIIAKLFKVIRDKRFLDGWKIDSIVSAVCIRNNIPDTEIHEVFQTIYGDDYEEQTTDRLIEKTREKIHNNHNLPDVFTVIYYAKQFLKSSNLSEEEKQTVLQLYKDFKKQVFGDRRMPDYLVGAERVFVYASVPKTNKKEKRTYYREKWFIEKNNRGIKEVWYVEINSLYYKDISKDHTVVGFPIRVGIKTDIKRLLQENTEVYELIINDNALVRPSFNFSKLEDTAKEIEKACSRYVGRFNIPLYQDYLTIKKMEYLAEYDNNPPVCQISKNTGWNADNTMFFHYDLNDEYHELDQSNTLYKENLAQSSDAEGIKRQHEIVLSLLKEGKYLGVLLALSSSSILLKPLEISPLTVVLSGNGGAGKTTSALIATSLFYKSEIEPNTTNATKVSIELTMAHLNSLPFLLDEGALAGTGISLQQLIFSVASGRGKARGRKDLSVDFKKLKSNLFWTTETSDLDDIRRSGAFRRVLHLIINSKHDFTSVFDLDEVSEHPNKLYTGCGVDYIRYAVKNIKNIREQLNKETQGFGKKYGALSGVATNVYAGIVLLEQWYNTRFEALRKTANAILEEAKRTFLSSKADIIDMLEQHLFTNISRLGQVRVAIDKETGKVKTHNDGTPVYERLNAINKDRLGDYDETEQIFYITADGMKTIAKELEKERTILINDLHKAGVLKNTNAVKYRSKYSGESVRFYVLNFKNAITSNNDETTNEDEPSQTTNVETMKLISNDVEPTKSDNEPVCDDEPENVNAIELEDEKDKEELGIPF